MKTLAAALISALLFSAIAGALLINFATAQFIPPSVSVSVIIQLPENKVYTQNRVPVAFTYTITESHPGAEPMVGAPQFRCFLNGKTVPFSPNFDGSRYYTQISGLPDGSHSLKVYVDAFYENWMFGNVVTWTGVSDTVFFTIDTTPPRISVLSPEQQKTYNTTTLPIDFSISETVTWMGYSLDGHETVTIEGNTTLTGLSEGTHTIIVYATDTAGNAGTSKPIHFTVRQEAQQSEPEPPEPQSEPFPATWVATASVASIVVVGVGLLVYFRKRKHQP